MGERTGIAWTDATWNPIRGCSRVSEGCRNCYAEKIAARFSGPGKPFHGVVTHLGRWNGQVELVESALDLPLRWRKPRRIFVNSMSDLFHERVPVVWMNRIFAVMEAAPQHTFQVLTKRPRRMEMYCRLRWLRVRPSNVWLGISAEDDDALNSRWPALRETPAAIRFISAEPLLSCFQPPDGIDWLILGCESGPGRRNQEGYAYAAQTMIEQARAAGVAVFHKQMPITGRVSRNPAEWPEWARVQEWPALFGAVSAPRPGTAQGRGPGAPRDEEGA